MKSSNSTGAVVNPVFSARISTKGHYAIQYGKVEVVAKIPQGDWLWPAIWMLPENSTYGAWPLSGEIDVSSFHCISACASLMFPYEDHGGSR